RSGAPPCAYQLSRNRPRTRRTGGEGGTGSPRSAPLFGLAPQGVCRASSVAGRAVRSYRTVSPLPDPRRNPAVCSLLHCPSRRLASPLASLLPVGARTFLSAPARRPREATAWSSPAWLYCTALPTAALVPLGPGDVEFLVGVHDLHLRHVPAFR